MKIIEVGTGYTSIPANMGAATEIVVEELGKVFEKENVNYEIFDIKDEERQKTDLRIREIYVPKCFRKKDVSLGIMHKLKRVVYSINLAKVLKKEIKKSNEEIIIHFHNQYNMFFFCKLVPKSIKEKVKLVYTVHSYIWNGNWNDIESVIKKRYFQEIFCVKHADKICVLNNITKEHFEKKLNISDEKIIVMNNGVNIDIYKPLKNSDEKVVFFQAGSVCERKNQLGALTMLSEYIKNNFNISYEYAGGIIDQEYQNKIFNFSKENNIEAQVNYLGEVNPGKELNRLYNRGKAFMFPSTAEAFSLVILEAMACGLPVIMNRSSIKEVSNELEKVILFFNNEEELKEIINEKILNENIRKELSIASRKCVEEFYSWDTVAKEYLKVMKNQ